MNLIIHWNEDSIDEVTQHCSGELPALLIVSQRHHEQRARTFFLDLALSALVLHQRSGETLDEESL